MVRILDEPELLEVEASDLELVRRVCPAGTYELVEVGLITAEDFRDFTFANAARLWGTQNPKFFEGTAVAKAAAAVLADTPSRAAASAA